MSAAKEFFILGLENYLRGDYELAKIYLKITRT